MDLKKKKKKKKSDHYCLKALESNKMVTRLDLPVLPLYKLNKACFL